VQAHVPERVLAAGFVSAPRAATWWARTSRLVEPTAGATRDRDDGSVAPGFPSPLWLAVTGTRVYAFVARPGAVGALVGAWDRRDLSVSKAPRLVSTRLSLSFGGSGPPTAVVARRWKPGNHLLVTLLVDPSRTT
jgi:hypothetical protein